MGPRLVPISVTLKDSERL